jgi:hypothetical protein
MLVNQMLSNFILTPNQAAVGTKPLLFGLPFKHSLLLRAEVHVPALVVLRATEQVALGALELGIRQEAPNKTVMLWQRLPVLNAAEHHIVRQQGVLVVD